MQTYDLTKPRYSVCNQTEARLESDHSHLTFSFETLSDNEAAFWAIIGYTVEVAVYCPDRGIFVYSHSL